MVEKTEPAKPLSDGLKFRTRWTIARYRGDFKSEAEAIAKGAKPYLVTVVEGNLGLNEGITELLNLITGTGSPTAWNNANARIGVGNSNTAASPTQTGLQGASKAFKAMDSGYPSVTNQTATFKATFGTSEGNFAWEEGTVVNAADDSGKNLNRKVTSQGTKTSSDTWIATMEITVA